MIHVFFDCGSFGSTVEYVLHNYTNHEDKINGTIQFDGSMHCFQKQYHITDITHLENFLNLTQDQNGITTVIYPFQQLELPAILDCFTKLPSWSTDKKVLIFQPDLKAVELNLLFKYHKVCVGTINAGLEFLIGNNTHNLSGWNASYTHWSNMQPWELREWYSIFYPGATANLIAAPSQVAGKDWLAITNTDILYNTGSAVERVIEYSGLLPQNDIHSFVQQWQTAQQYVVDEFNLLDQIVDHSVANQSLEWEPINIIAEAIVQQRLRTLGFEIRCDGLNTFPCDAKTLYNLLEKV